ncbi:sirohydrochlorin ferrochelatase [Striga asiatica]|uniref:Sirohydrochlorin ferrochelatase n=1 Tax=Striga asiatica TaxID=4170 RepID=A0A5A7QRI1_STRAF|nr:sirohydrochlorin ferrochelatase [Striga asiatica]
MEVAASSSVSPSRYFLSVSRLSPTNRGYTVINHSRAIPKFVKLCQDPLKSKYSHSRLCLASTNGGSFRKPLKGVVEGDGIVIVDHGSRRKESNLLLNDFVVMFKEKTKYPIVEPAHMELAEPSIKDAFNSCVQKGAKRVIVSPFFLFPGRHWHQDIPSLTAEAAKEHPGITYVITAPLGLHELLVDVMNDRITYCLSHVSGEVDECSVCAGTGKCRLQD